MMRIVIIQRTVDEKVFQKIEKRLVLKNFCFSQYPAMIRQNKNLSQKN